MEERIEVVVLACHGTLVNWRDGVEAVLYRVARVHGESPLDRGRALRRRLEALQARGSVASANEGSEGAGSLVAAYEALVAERGYRWAEPGEAAFQRVVAGCRPFADAAPALASARAAGLRIVAVSSADPRLVDAALRPLDGAFDDVLAGCGLGRAARTIGVPAQRVLHIAAAASGLRAAAALGMRAAWLNRDAARPPDGAAFDVEWRSLHALRGWVGGRRPIGATR